MLIAFFVTAGAVPLFRRFFQPSASHEGADGVPGAVVVPRVAGAGMLFGVFMSLFYLDTSPGSATDLFVAGVLLALVGSWMGRPGAQRTAAGGPFGYELAASALAGLLLLFVTPAMALDWSLAGAMLVALVMVTPAAVAFVGRTRPATPHLPAAIVLIELLLLVLLGALDIHDAQSPAQYKDFRIVAIPTAGALIGALIYLCRMPWRVHTSVSTGMVTCLCLGLVVAWGAARLSADSTEYSGWYAALWILSVPVFELLRRYAVVVLKGFPLGLAASAGDEALMEVDPSSMSMVVFTLALGGVGIALQYLDVPDFWSALALLPAWLAYSLAPMLVSTFSRRHPPDMVDAQS